MRLAKIYQNRQTDVPKPVDTKMAMLETEFSIIFAIVIVVYVGVGICILLRTLNRKK